MLELVPILEAAPIGTIGSMTSVASRMPTSLTTSSASGNVATEVEAAEAATPAVVEEEDEMTGEKKGSEE